MAKKADFDRQALAVLLHEQRGVITSEQARACGLGREAVRYRARSGGPWQPLVPGVYLTHTGVPTGCQREMAALLYAGPGSVLTGAAALRRHDLSAALRRQDLDGAADGRVDVLVPAATQRRDAGFARLHRTTRLPQAVCLDGVIKFAFAPRAVADLVRELSLPQARQVVAEAVHRRRCTISMLAAELAAGPVRDSARLRRVLAEVADGVRSTAEADLRDLITWARLPPPLYNPRLFIGQAFLAMPDCWWPDAGVAAEVDSREWHLSPRDWQDTLARHTQMSAQGIVVLHFTPRQIRTDRASVAAAIRDALAPGRARPLRHIRTLPPR